MANLNDNKTYKFKNHIEIMNHYGTEFYAFSYSKSSKVSTLFFFSSAEYSQKDEFKKTSIEIRNPKRNYEYKLSECIFSNNIFQPGNYMPVKSIDGYVDTNHEGFYNAWKKELPNENLTFNKPYEFISKIASKCDYKPPEPPTPKPGKSQQQEYQFIDKAETMKYLQGQDITISCEVDGDIELESGGVLFQYQLEGQDTYTDVKAEVTTSSAGKKRIWVRVKLP